MFDNKIFLVMELMASVSLTEVLDRKRLSEGTFRFLAYQMLLALDYLHSKSIVHGDLKPGNIFVASRSETLITFKLAEVRLTNAVYNGYVTKDFKAPEVYDL